MNSAYPDAYPDGSTENNQNFAPNPPFQSTDYQTQSTGYQTHPPAAPASDAPGDQGAGNIDKIRDILFGSNMRDYELRFAHLEEALKKESADLRDSTRRHLESLESFVHKELAALEARLNTERDERSASAAIHPQERSARWKITKRKPIAKFATIFSSSPKSLPTPSATRVRRSSRCWNGARRNCSIPRPIAPRWLGCSMKWRCGLQTSSK